MCELCRELVAEIVQRILRHRDTRSTMLLRHIEVVKAETSRITKEGQVLAKAKSQPSFETLVRKS